MNITYLLGAGASHGALPVVKEMESAVECQLIWLKKLFGVGLIPTIGTYEKELRSITKKAHEFGTFDTYARSLYLLGDMDTLNFVKYHLSLFFTIELFHPQPKLNQNGFKYAKSRAIDGRYYGWLATILKEDVVIPDNINIITWNYDIQVELALSRYKKWDDPTQLFAKEVLGVRRDDQNTSNLPFLIHLNGVAGIHYDKKDGFSYLFKKAIGLSNEEKVTKLLTHYNEYYDNQRDVLIKKVAHSFSFAWEENDFTDQVQRVSEEIMRGTDILIIIGYSFPSFNRRWDLRLIHNFIQNDTGYRRIVIQNQTLSKETVMSYLLLSQYANPIKIQVESDVTQFYIPPELFNE